jgi:hypothetical protein
MFRSVDALIDQVFNANVLDRLDKAKLGCWFKNPEVSDADLHLSFDEWKAVIDEHAPSVSFLNAAFIFVGAATE